MNDQSDSARIGALSVLVVEDNFQSINLMKSMLADLGISEIYTAKDGAEALNFLGSCDDLINIVLCDWNMPRMSGIELLRQIRSVDRDLPFIMVTGSAEEQAVREAISVGVTGYLAKPYSAVQLKKKLTTVSRIIRAASKNSVH